MLILPTTPYAMLDDNFVEVNMSVNVMQLVQNNWIWNTIFTDFLHQDIYLFFTCSQFFNIESADSGFHLVTLLTGKVT